MAIRGYEEEDIIRYLRGDMDDNEKEKFEKIMGEDSALKEEVEFHRQIKKGVELNVKKETKDYLKTFEEKKYRLNSFKWFKAVAIIIVIIITGLAIFFPFLNQPSNQKLTAQFFEPYPNHLTEHYRGRGKENHVPGAIDSAMTYYSSGNYKKSAFYLKEAISKGSQRDLAYFYLGNSYLAIGKPEKAIESFKKGIGELPDEYGVKNSWYLALGYLSNNQPEKSKEILKGLCKEESEFYCKKSKKLLRKLD